MQTELVFVFISVFVTAQVVSQQYTHCDAPARDEPCLFSRCQHGRCVNSTKYGITSEKCVCDEGWVSFYCEECCRCQDDELCVPDPFDNPQCIPITTEGQSNVTVASDTTSEVLVTQRPEEHCNATARNESSDCPNSFSYCENGDCLLVVNTTDKYFCSCDAGWAGFFCELCCTLPCVNGYCQATNENQEPLCECFEGYEGELCENIRPNQTEIVYFKKSEIAVWTWYIIACACVIILAVLVMTYVMWRRRNIYMLRLIHFIQTRKHPDSPDDGKLYDVFVSYADEDVNFVINSLLPKFDELGFSVFLRERDSVGGDVTAEETLRAIEGSRRTLLVLSPHFFLSEWPLFQVQQAHLSSLKERHGIIPVIITDISEVPDINPLIHSIMKTWRCLHWPDETHDEEKAACGTATNEQKRENFWKRMQLALPKYSNEKSDMTDSDIIKANDKSELTYI